MVYRASMPLNICYHIYNSMNVPNIEKDYMKLPSDIREKYVYDVVKETVFLNRDGVSLTQLTESLPFSRAVIGKHLEKLVSVNEAYHKEYGKTIVYFPNSRAIHCTLETERTLNSKIFRVVQIDNMLGDFIYIQEYQEGAYGREIKGGLMVPVKSFTDFSKLMNEINTKLGGNKDAGK